MLCKCIGLPINQLLGIENDGLCDYILFIWPFQSSEISVTGWYRCCCCYYYCYRHETIYNSFIRLCMCETNQAYGVSDTSVLVMHCVYGEWIVGRSVSRAGFDLSPDDNIKRIFQLNVYCRQLIGCSSNNKLDWLLCMIWEYWKLYLWNCFSNNLRCISFGHWNDFLASDASWFTIREHSNRGRVLLWGSLLGWTWLNVY